MRRWAAPLVMLVVSLMSIGIVMLASTSGVEGLEGNADSYHFLKRQLMWVAIALTSGLVIVRIDYRWFQQSFVMGTILFVSVLGLLLVLVPGIGHEVGGATRWVRIGPISVQPSEFAKIGIVIVLCAWLAGIGENIRKWVPGVVLPLITLGGILALIMLEPDFGTTALTACVAGTVMLVAGVRWYVLVGGGVFGGIGFATLVRHDPVRFGRIMAFLEPTAPENEAAAYQLLQSLAAIVRGGELGVGLGRSLQKHRYLPEAHTDFILAIIAEELGAPGTWFVALAFIGITICGMVISLRAPDMFGRLLAFGLTLMIALQAAINMGVVTGCLPTKGIALPFISYGGSSLVVSVVCVALLVNIARATDLAVEMSEA